MILYENNIQHQIKTGTNITITNTLNTQIDETKLSKLSTQETTTGKNVLSLRSNIEQEVHGITFKYEQETQTFTINGTCDTNNTTWLVSNLASFNFTINQTTISAHYISGSISNGGLVRCSSQNYGTRTEVDLTQLSSSNPIVAKTEPKTPATLYPTNVDVFIAIGPGVDSAIMKMSPISPLLSHFFFLTISSSINGIIAYPPPKVNKPILKKVKKSVRHFFIIIII